MTSRTIATSMRPTLMRYPLCILLLLASAAVLHAQPDLDEALRARVGLIARPSRDSIVLRWAPSKPGVWLIGNRIGYRIERAQARPDGRPGTFTVLVDTAIKPWSYEQWIAYHDLHPRKGGDSVDYVAIAYNLLDQFSEDGLARERYSDDELTSIAERKNELEMRFGFAMYAVDRSSDAATGLGLRFVDRAVTPGATYIYRVYLAGRAGEYRLDTGMVTVTAASIQPERLAIVAQPGPGNGEILLRWRASRYHGSYFVDRSEDEGATFRRMNIVPLVTLRPASPTETDEELYLDSTSVEGQVYLYRIYGTTPFGDEELLAEVRGAARDVTAPEKPFLPNPEHVAARSVRVRWQPGEPVAGDLAGFRVLRAPSDSGPFTSLTPRPLSPSSRELIDSGFSEGEANYYLIEAIDTAGNVSRSNSAYVALIDSTPPGQPRWIGGRMDTNGVVTLRLRANPERDLMGYRVLRANAPDHEFSVVRESFAEEDERIATDTVQQDTVTLKTLTRYVYYRVTALDRNHNESEFSEVLAVPRPDIVPPVVPVITDVAVTDSSVRLLFAASSSADVAYQVVYRRSEGDARWDSIARRGGRDTLFLDRGVKRSVLYEYTLRAVDSSDLRSDLSMPVSARPYDNGVRPGVTAVRGAYDSARGVAELQWEFSGMDEEHYFMVYRSVSGAPLRKYARVSSTQRDFTDTAATSETGIVIYAVRVVTPSGAQSALSEKVELGRRR